ncbi:glycosyltransferase family 4 protein [Flammeovirgaceae bacterium SG7u.111]|nr:glycosyltransferase family 4 protein [Flammeovirgaceae bacterium SG7u.132]WPO37210.1 glycosyltransferase family 4 protein [Flammeovirgaceae bacterium SG7u.111]
MPKLLWLTDNYPPQRGGMSQSCDRIVNGLRCAGFTIEIIHFVNKGRKLARKQQQNGGYTAMPFAGSEAHVLNLTWNYIKTLGEFDYIVCFGGYLSMIGAPVFSKWSGTALVTLIRGNDLDNSIFTPRKRSVLEDALRQSEFVFTVSSDKAEKVRKWLGHEAVHYIPNGIDKKEWIPTASETDFAQTWKETNSAGKLTLGLFGQLKDKKGLDFFLEALRRTSLAEKAHLLLIGEIEEYLMDELEQMACTFTLLPFHDRYELMKYYLCCDALVIPSFYDGMPNVLLEAGALGKNIIASEVDGMADILEHGNDGLLFAPGNEDECRKVLYQYFAMPEEERNLLGERLKSKIENQYSQEHEIEAYKKFLA